jgi:excinuclease ABC subunit C
MGGRAERDSTVSRGGTAPHPTVPTASGGRANVAPAENAESEDDAAFPSRPDLVIVDGGKGQFEAARRIMDECGAGDIPLVAIAKGADRNAMRETFHMAGREPFKLQPRDPALYFIQRLRDEAHRFAIGTHRARRKKDTMTNPLDEIAGIGPSRKRALLLHFGTVKAIQRARLEELMGAPGVNAATAKAVHDHFHEG